MNKREKYFSIAVAILLIGFIGFLALNYFEDDEVAETSNTSTINVTECEAGVDTQCMGLNRKIPAPASCVTEDGSADPELASRIEGLTEDGQLDCTR